MSDPNYALFAVTASIAGVASHLGFFIHGEHDQHSAKYALSLITAPVLFFLGLLKLGIATSYTAAFMLTTITNVSFLTSLTLSILIYRTFFHRLRHFPGPFSAKLSKFFHAFRLIGSTGNYLQADALHKKYGNIVRVGPRELTIFTPDALVVTNGPGSKCYKPFWYEGTSYPDPNVMSTRSRTLHDKRRKVWDRGFSTKALKNYESRVALMGDLLVSKFAELSGESANAADWFEIYAFDVMGDLAFGHSFDGLKNGQLHPKIKLVKDVMSLSGLIAPIMWMAPIITSLPGANAINEFREFANEQLMLRKENEPDIPDVFSWLLDAEKSHTDPAIRDPMWSKGDWLKGDARLIIIAGSDTTSGALTFLFYDLCHEPHHMDKIREELKSINYRSGSPTECRDLQDLPYLNGCINETLRLHPVVPSGLQRVTPPEGVTIDGVYIPGDVVLSAPSHTIQRLPTAYKEPLSFLPERWSTKPELILDKRAYTPFASGVYSCPGKQLALMELRTVTAKILSRFDVAFAEGEDGSALLRDTKDNFTLACGHLKLRFVERKEDLF